ncbi:MAG TPA: hypothetical protein DCX60_00855, partial [Phycisphaerales bacterium]|nr:hypothetical protein [Phycisphaerales bacterium]
MCQGRCQRRCRRRCGRFGFQANADKDAQGITVLTVSAEPTPAGDAAAPVTSMVLPARILELNAEHLPGTVNEPLA